MKTEVLEKKLQMMKKQQEWLKNQPSRRERRILEKKESRLNRVFDTLIESTDKMEDFELQDFLRKNKVMDKVLDYFFPEAIEIDEVEVPHEPQSSLSPEPIKEYNTTEQSNVAYVDFKKK